MNTKLLFQVERNSTEPRGFDRALYSDGAITAAKWLFNKKPDLYSMRNLLNFK